MDSNKPNDTLIMGHRGTGTCDQQAIQRDKSIANKLDAPAPITENTLGAMKAAHEAGGQYVEFDVQLTKDFHSVIYHDFYTSDGVFIGDLTLKQLKDRNENIADDQQHQFPTLKEFFTQLPPDLGFDIEIKYPRTMKDGDSMCPEFKWDMEEYVGKIVSEVKLYMQCVESSQRPIFYSCFVSEVCQTLQQLHPEYPVVYLIGSKNANDMTEINGYTLESAFQFATKVGLHGVAVNAEQLLTNPLVGKKFVQKCKQAKLKCYSWGLDNNKRENRVLQRDWGIDGVIFDNIHFELAHF